MRSWKLRSRALLSPCRTLLCKGVEASSGQVTPSACPPYNLPHTGSAPMLGLYSCPALFGVADNNGYGLKVYAFLKLTGVPFTHEHIFDASKAPRGQLPYIVDDGETVGDSDTIIAHLIRTSRAHHRCRADDRRSATRTSWSRACSTTSTGSCPIRAGRTSGTGRRSATRSHASIRHLTDEGLLKAKDVQRAALPLSGHRPLRARRRACARARRSTSARPPDSGARLRARRQARPASTPASMASSPTSPSTTSTRRLSVSSWRTRTWRGTAAPSTTW